MRNLLAVLLFVASGFVAEADDPWNRREAELKAAMLLNFGRFTVYPERKQEGNFKICVLGESPFGEAIDTIEGKQVREQVVETVLLEKYSAEVSACHILYISSSVDGGYKQFLQEVETEPILTVSQIELEFGVSIPLFLAI